MKIFKIHEKFIIRHNILKHLMDRVNRQLGIKRDLTLSNMPLLDLAKRLNVEWPTLQKYHYELHTYQQVKCFIKDNVNYIGIEEKGMFALDDDFWMNEGKKELDERIYSKTKWVVPVLSFVLAVASLTFAVYTTISTTNKVQLLQQEIQVQKKQLERLAAGSVSLQGRHK